MSARQQIAEQSETFARGLLKERLALCTSDEQDFFNNRVFPGGVKTEDLAGAIDLCNRTIKKRENSLEVHQL